MRWGKVKNKVERRAPHECFKIHTGPVFKQKSHLFPCSTPSMSIPKTNRKVVKIYGKRTNTKIFVDVI